MNKKVLITLGVPAEQLEKDVARLSAEGIEVLNGFPACGASEDALVELAQGIEVGMIGTEPWTRSVIERCPDLKLLVRAGTGFDTVDLKAASERGIMVANTPYLNTYAVAEFALTLILAVLRMVKPFDQLVSYGGWKPLPASELRGKTVGLLGFGRIAQELAALLQPFGCRLLAYDVYRNETAAARLNVGFASLDEVLSASDVVSLHMPLTAETENMMNAAAFAKMKTGSIVVNTSRGGVMDADALFEALQNNKLAGAGLDVHVIEPLPENYKLRYLNNVILTPHCASGTQEATDAIIRACTDAVLDYYGGKAVQHILNP